MNGSSYSAWSNIETGVASVRSGDVIEAESHDAQFGLTPWLDRKIVTNIDGGDWIRYRGVNLSGKSKITFRLAAAYSGGKIEIWADSIGPNGKKLGTLDVQATGKDRTYNRLASETTSLLPMDGWHDLYLKIPGTGSGVANIDSFQLRP
jgi:hypothetical protein